MTTLSVKWIAAEDGTALCGCGCGQPAPIARKTGRGIAKGQPLRFVNTHNNRLGRADHRCPECGGPRSEARAVRCLKCDVAARRAAGVVTFWASVDRSGGPDACWPWLGFVAENGYGKASDGSMRHEYAHRRAYRLAVGAIPDGTELDHVCHTLATECAGGPTCQHRRCANPRHLQAVPHLVNVRRGRSPWASRRRVAA